MIRPKAAALAVFTAILVTGWPHPNVMAEGVATMPLTKDDVLSIRDGRFFLDGQPFAEISFNKFDLFWQLYDQLDAGRALDAANPMLQAQDRALRELHEMGFRTIRIFALPWGPRGPESYAAPEKRKLLYAALDKTLELCDTYDIRVVWSLAAGTFTDTKLVPGKGWVHGEEHQRELISNPASRGRQLLHRYIDETVERYRHRRAVLMWEVGNETTLSADIGSHERIYKGERMPTLKDVAAFFDDVAKRIKAADPLRLVNSGGSHMRESQWNLYTNRSWRKDTFEEQFKCFDMLYTDNAVDVIDVHSYMNNRPGYVISDGAGGEAFLDNRDWMTIARRIGKPLMIGELGLHARPKTDRKIWDVTPDYFESYSDTAAAKPWVEKSLNSVIDTGVQLSYWWCYQSDRAMDQNNPQRFDITRGRNPELLACFVAANKRLRSKLRAGPDIRQTELAEGAAVRPASSARAETVKAGPAAAERAPAPIDCTTWDLTTWRAWPFDYEELGVRTAPLASGKVGDWTSIGDSWVARNGGNAAAIRVRNVKADFADFRVTDFYITGGGNEDGPNRIFCATAVPVGVQGRVPVLFVFHGGGGHASGALALSIARKNPGFAGVAVDYNGQFRPSKSPVTKWVTVTAELRKPEHNLIPNKLNFPMYHFAQASRRVLDWVDEQSWADRDKYGAVGISYGGWVSFFIAGQDARIKTVYTGVSAAGTAGMRGRACLPHDWRPAKQLPIWMANADPAVYAKQTQARVYLNLSTVDRFFWLDGAARQRDTFPHKAQWLLRPNSDHGNGGPELPDTIGLWHRTAMLGDASFPAFREVVCAGNMAVASIDSGKPLQAVYLAWAPGDAVSVARYYLWIRAEETDGRWFARIPDTLRDLCATYYFTAIDEDGRAVSSDLMKNEGDGIREALVWQDGCLWDVASGAAAWRSDLAGDRAAIEDAENGRVTFAPTRPGKRVAVLSNSFAVGEAAGTMHQGIRIELGGNGASFKAHVVLSRDYQSLDMQTFAAEVTVSPDVTTSEIPWDVFTEFGRETTERNNLPANGLVLITPSMPASGLTVGRVEWLDRPK